MLIVEDVADLRDFYAILLREEGYECACATDGSDAGIGVSQPGNGEDDELECAGGR